MKKLITGGPAFLRGPLGEDCGKPWGHEEGMTLRDYFAGQALAAIIAKHGPMGRGASPDTGRVTLSERDADCVQNAMAIGAYEYADAMLEARK